MTKWSWSDLRSGKKWSDLTLYLEYLVTFPHVYFCIPKYRVAGGLWHLKHVKPELGQITFSLIWDQIKIIWSKHDLRSDQIVFFKIDLIWSDLIWSDIFRSFSDQFPILISETYYRFFFGMRAFFHLFNNFKRISKFISAKNSEAMFKIFGTSPKKIHSTIPEDK